MGAMISRKTLIANGYHQDIFARVENDKSSAVKCGATHLRVPTYSSSNNNNNFRCDADGKRQQEKKLQDDDDDDEFTTHELFKEKLFTKIGPGFRACFRTARNANDSHHHQQQQQSGGGDGVGGGTNNNNGQEEVYISIALANGDFICRGLPVSCRRNGCIIIIVDGKGNLKTGQPAHSTIVTAAGSTKSKAAWKDFVVADDDDNMNNQIKKNI